MVEMEDDSRGECDGGGIFLFKYIKNNTPPPHFLCIILRNKRRRSIQRRRSYIELPRFPTISFWYSRSSHCMVSSNIELGLIVTNIERSVIFLKSNTHLFYCTNFSVFINKIMFYYLYCSVSQDSPSSKTSHNYLYCSVSQDSPSSKTIGATIKYEVNQAHHT